jgi:hypothetical protein
VRAIPGAKTPEFLSAKLRPETEPWEVRGRELKPVDFKDKLSTVAEKKAEQEKNRDPSLERRKRRRLTRQEHLARLESQGWDNGFGRRPGWRQNLKDLPWGLVALAIVAIVIWVAKVRGLSKRQTDIPQGPPPSAAVRSTQYVNPDDALEIGSIRPHLKSINQAAMNFLLADSLEKILPLIRDPERVKPLMEAYYAKNGPPQIQRYTELLASDKLVALRRFVLGTIELEGFEKRTLVFEKKGDAFLVDWEAYVGHSEKTLAEMVQQRPKTPTLCRVVLEHVQYYNGGFLDTQKYMVVKVSDVHREPVVYAYFEKLSPVALQLADALVGRPVQQLHAVVTLQAPDFPADENQFLLVEFKQNGWAFREKDNDAFIKEETK